MTQKTKKKKDDFAKVHSLVINVEDNIWYRLIFKSCSTKIMLWRTRLKYNNVSVIPSYESDLKSCTCLHRDKFVAHPPLNMTNVFLQCLRKTEFKIMAHYISISTNPCTTTLYKFAYTHQNRLQWWYFMAINFYASVFKSFFALA